MYFQNFGAHNIKLYVKFTFQQFELTWHKDIRPGKRTVCFDVSQSIKKAPVILFNCHGMGGNQRFKYNMVSI
jgi:polypeptide N-acetylgalactosaminyltransferase